MKKLFTLVFVAIVCVVMSSCGVATDTMAGVAATPNVVLRENNFKVVDQVTASASVTRVFGIGGISRQSVRVNATAKMMEKANLTGSQTVVNITERRAIHGVAPIYTVETVTVSGTVIEFTDGLKVNITEE